MANRFSPIDFRIRDFQPSDSVAVNEAALTAWEQYRRSFSDSAWIFQFLSKTADLAADADLIVAESGSSIVGVVLYVAPGRRREAIFPLEWALIRLLSVTLEARGRGIGRKLTEECIRRARRDGAQIIGLHTSPVMGVALGLYGRMGFAFDRNIPDRHGVAYAVYKLAL
jgi:GNAT superfamily N-acetyltransferase